MKSTDTAIANLRRRAVKSAVEVEHLTELAVLGDVRAVAAIRELQNQYGWPRSNREGAAHVVPLGRWAEVVCAYLEGGADALVAYARCEEPKSFHFAVSILEELNSAAAVFALAELAGEVERDLPGRLADAVKLAEAVNLTLPLKRAADVPVATTERLCAFLHRVLRQALNEAQRAAAVCALRSVGDESSIELLKAMPVFTGPWSGLESAAIKAIRKRHRRQLGGDG